MQWQWRWLRSFGFILLGNIVFFSLAFATPYNNAPAAAATPTPRPLSLAEQLLVDEVAGFTKRDMGEQATRRLRDGGEVAVLDTSFMPVILTRIDAAGNPVTRCVLSAQEAIAFLREALPAPTVMRERAAQPTPSEAAVRASIRASQISIVNRDGPNEGFNDPTPATPIAGNTGTTLGQQRLIAFQYAAALWSQQLNSPVPIQIGASFDPLQCNNTSGVLGAAGPENAISFSQQPAGTRSDEVLLNTLYPVALANKLLQQDVAPTQVDLGAIFNSSIGSGLCSGFSFYLGLNANEPRGQVNLVTVLLHEFAHGLGFISLVDERTGRLVGGRIDIFSRYLFDTQIGKGWAAMTDAERRASAANGRGTLVWSGPNVTAAARPLLQTGLDGSGRVRMFAPNPVQSGSSVSHWDRSAAPDLLMEPSASNDQTLDFDLTIPLFRDIGWFAGQAVEAPGSRRTYVSLLKR